MKPLIFGGLQVVLRADLFPFTLRHPRTGELNKIDGMYCKTANCWYVSAELYADLRMQEPLDSKEGLS